MQSFVLQQQQQQRHYYHHQQAQYQTMLTNNETDQQQQQQQQQQEQQLNVQVINDFILADVALNESVDSLINAKIHFNIKNEAFKVLQLHYMQTYNTDIDSNLIFKESIDEVSVSRDSCTHYLISKIAEIVNVLKMLETMPKFKHNMYVFMPYCRQLKTILSFFRNDYCCKKKVAAQLNALQDLMETCELYFNTIRALQVRLHVMMVFDEPELYECYICHETSQEKRFLKPSECCGFNICGMCYAQLWQHSTLYPVCPVCKTSFKTVADHQAPKIEN
nr:ie0 [Calliteara abietis nucleopolyhedrovirus]